MKHLVARIKLEGPCYAGGALPSWKDPNMDHYGNKLEGVRLS